MKKILYILSSSSPFGGSTKSIETIIEKIQRSGNCIVGIVLPTKSGVYSDWTARGWTVYAIKMRHSNYPPHQNVKDVLLFPIRLLLHKLINKSAYYSLKRIIKKNSYDLVHTNVGVLDVGYKAAKATGIPHVYHLREYQDLDFGEHIYPSHEEFNKMLKASFNYTIAITRNLFNYFECGSTNAEVIYNGIIEHQPQIDWKKEKYFLFVGRLSDTKGTADVIRSFGTIHSEFPDYKLVLAGASISESYRKELYRLVTDLGITDKVNFLGPVSYCSDLMRKATCMIVASKSEGLGRVTIEAMSEGCLVIGYNKMGTKEQFDNGLEIYKHEIGLRYNTFEELVMLMRSVVVNGIEYYAEMISHAQDTTFRLYTVMQCYEKILNVYNKLLDENKK